MAKIKITLTNDMLSLVSNIRFTEFPVVKDDQKVANWGIDLNSIYGGSYLLEDISYILGCYDQHIAGTEENAMGPEFPEELEKYMFNTHMYVWENLQNIEEIVHQFSTRGGLTEGTYECKDYEHIWSKAVLV